MIKSLFATTALASAATFFGYVWFSGGFNDPEAKAILQEIADNLQGLESLTADVDCISNSTSGSFVGGFWAMDGNHDMYLCRGNSGEVYWRNSEAFNLTSPLVGVGDTGGLRWDSTVEDAFSAWGEFVGLEDLRVAVGMAGLVPGGMTKKPGTHLVQGIYCTLLEADGIRLYVDETENHRLIRIETEYENSDSIAYQTNFLEWTSVTGGEFPARILCICHRALNQQDTVVYEYFLDNMEGKAEIDPTLFDLNFMPKDN